MSRRAVSTRTSSSGTVRQVHPCAGAPTRTATTPPPRTPSWTPSSTEPTPSRSRTAPRLSARPSSTPLPIACRSTRPSVPPRFPACPSARSRRPPISTPPMARLASSGVSAAATSMAITPRASESPRPSCASCAATSIIPAVSSSACPAIPTPWARRRPIRCAMPSSSSPSCRTPRTRTSSSVTTASASCRGRASR